MADYWLTKQSIQRLYFFVTIEYLAVARYLDDGAEEKADMTMTDYRKRAEECTEIAQTARTPAQRTMLLHIAETWMNLARDAEGNSPSTVARDARATTSLN
jgi:hypothetical protein